jgi:hypothetical protein
MKIPFASRHSDRYDFRAAFCRAIPHAAIKMLMAACGSIILFGGRT